MQQTVNSKFAMESEIQKLKLPRFDHHKLQNKQTFGIYQKPIATDHIILKHLFHPYENKTSALNYVPK
jgi:hypothetical protein